MAKIEMDINAEDVKVLNISAIFDFLIGFK